MCHSPGLVSTTFLDTWVSLSLAPLTGLWELYIPANIYPTGHVSPFPCQPCCENPSSNPILHRLCQNASKVILFNIKVHMNFKGVAPTLNSLYVIMVIFYLFFLHDGKERDHNGSKLLHKVSLVTTQGTLKQDTSTTPRHK